MLWKYSERLRVCLKRMKGIRGRGEVDPLGGEYRARRGPTWVDKEGTGRCGQRIHKEEGHGGAQSGPRRHTGGVRPAQSSEGSRCEHRLDTRGATTSESALCPFSTSCRAQGPLSGIMGFPQGSSPSQNWDAALDRFKCLYDTFSAVR